MSSPESRPPDSFPIVGIGASAGGIEALEGFFRGVPENPGFAIVIVTHLSPERESLLHEIVGRYTDLPVNVAADEMQVEINQAYVLPADAILSIANGKLLVRRNTARPERKPIDIFFSALAVDIGERAVGIVLSGGDGDGTLGVKAIKERGGLTLAQIADGFGPQYPDMPNSAIASGLVDFALPAEEMGPRLAEFARTSALLDDTMTSAGADNDHSLVGILPEIYSLLRNQVGHDFSGYKAKTFMRRLQRRMQVTQTSTIDGYVERLRQEPQEIGALFRDLLINVTNFFRDTDAFENLAILVMPKLFEGRGANDTVRIWVPGCATGEEVFSIAMLAREQMDRLQAVPRVQIFATDIDERALSVARAARYPAPLLETVSPERLKRFFIADGGSFIVSKDIRELCIFSPHSVIRDPPFSRIDLISCRNLLIYLGPDVQNLVIPTFHYALRPDGYLFLGTAENVSQFDDLFAPVEKKHRIFRRRPESASAIRVPIALKGLGAAQMSEFARRMPLGARALRQAADEQVLEQHAPAHVVINQDGDVVYYSSRTGKYLEAPPGAPTRHLFTMARKGLRLDLRSMFRTTVETGHATTRDAISAESDDGRVQLVNITIEPLADRGVGEPHYLVLFVDHGPVLSREEALNHAISAGDGTSVHIERELTETRDRLQSMIEEYETALEELKSSNEELVSVNEEMQSTNEELEASKEEQQSINEELHTVNSELNGKVDALDRANGDLRNFFESTDVATIFLDKKLVIRSFTPAVAKIFNILPGDRGRPITDLSSKLDLDHLTTDIAAVFAGAEPIERRIVSEDREAHYLVRIGPYRDASQRTEGVVVTFVEISNLARSEARQQMLIAELQHRTRNLLGIVQSIAQQTLGKGGSLDAFAIRLAALGRLQSLVGDGAKDEIDLADIVRLEIQVMGAQLDGKVKIAGPRVPLGFELVQTFGLALHELATNAMKYGALKEASGRLDVSWDVIRDEESGGALVLEWIESGVSNMPEPSHKGFGRELIEQALGFTMKAKARLEFGSDGLLCKIEMPLWPANGVKLD